MQGLVLIERPCAGSQSRTVREQFGYVFGRQFENVVMDRRGANDDLPPMFFDKPEFRTPSPRGRRMRWSPRFEVMPPDQLVPSVDARD